MPTIQRMCILHLSGVCLLTSIILYATFAVFGIANLHVPQILSCQMLMSKCKIYIPNCITINLGKYLNLNAYTYGLKIDYLG